MVSHFCESCCKVEAGFAKSHIVGGVSDADLAQLHDLAPSVAVIGIGDHSHIRLCQAPKAGQLRAFLGLYAKYLRSFPLLFNMASGYFSSNACRVIGTREAERR